MNSIHGIAFDLEGTIIDLEELHHSAHLKAASDVGISLNWEEAFKYLPHFIGGPDEKVAEEMVSFSKSNLAVDLIVKYKKKHFDQLLSQKKEISPRNGFLNFLKWIKNKKINIAIGSVTNHKQVKYILEKSNLLNEFNEYQIVTREDVKYPKPNPEVYLKTAEKLGIEPSHQLVIEDSIGGVEAGRKAGSRIIAIPTLDLKKFFASLIDEGAEKVFYSWDDPELKKYITNLLP